MNFLELAKEIEDKIIYDRRRLHQIPELELNLPKTSAYICKRLDKMGISYDKLIGGNAIIAYIGNYKEKCIAIRADMDGLEIKEETDLEFKSLHNGLMHACGHDGHVAMALGACELLKANEDKLGGLVKVFFQPGEEIPGGAEPMIKEGCLENPKVDRIVAIHEGGLFGEYPKGTIAIKKGEMMASMDAFTLKIIGKGGHGARPESFIDPISIISEINNAFYKIISREIDPLNPSLISVCQIHGGVNQNVIPDEVFEEGTVRCFNDETRDSLENRMKEVSVNIAKAYRAKAKFSYKRYYPSLINDDDFTDFVIKVATKLFGNEKVVNLKNPTMGADDFAFFLKKAKGTYISLNNLKPHSDGQTYPHHSSKFDIYEDTLYLGSSLLAEVCYRYLNNLQ